MVVSRKNKLDRSWLLLFFDYFCNLPFIIYFYIHICNILWDYFRLFSCGTSKDGESHIVEWNESEGAVKRTYLGFRKRSLGVVQFDTTKNRFLAAGDDFSIKYWDMDNVQLLTSVEADGGLPVNNIYLVSNTRFFRDFSYLLINPCL